MHLVRQKNDRFDLKRPSRLGLPNHISQYLASSCIAKDGNVLFGLDGEEKSAAGLSISTVVGHGVSQRRGTILEVDSDNSFLDDVSP